jgi:hypothetical protein
MGVDTADTVAAAQVPPHVQVIQMATAYWVSRAVFAVAHFGIADLLKDGPQAAEALAAATGTHGPTLRRVLRAVASIGVFRTDEQGRFALTPLGAALQSDAHGSARSSVIALAGDLWWPAWGEFLHCVRTGETGVGKVYGANIFDLLAQDPENASHFDAAMIGFHGAEPPAVAEAYDFSSVGTLVDVGGGTGNLLITILNTHPQLRGVLCDLPHVASEAERNVTTAGLAERCRVVPGSFFEAIPAGGDAYLLSHIIHDWHEDECLRILANCHTAMGAGGRLLIVESVLRAGDEPDLGKILDLVMLVSPGGQERTEQEYRALLKKAGFKLTRVVPTRSPVSVVEATPA